MQLEVLTIMRQRRSLATFGLHTPDPILGNIGDGDLAVERHMPALAELDLDLGGAAVSLALACEGLETALAGVIGVIDDPSFPRFAVAGGPDALADSHKNPSCAS